MTRLRYVIRADEFLTDFDVYAGRPRKSKAIGKVVKRRGDYRAVSFLRQGGAIRSGFKSLRAAIAWIGNASQKDLGAEESC